MDKRLRVGIVVIAVAAVAAGLVVVGFRLFIDGDSESLSSAQVINRAQVERIIDSPSKEHVALPADLPPFLEYIQVVRVDETTSEVHFQERGHFVVVCGGADPDSACDAETATVFRDEAVSRMRVRVAWVTSEDTARKSDAVASPDERAQIEDFWSRVSLTIGVAPWLHTFA